MTNSRGNVNGVRALARQCDSNNTSKRVGARAVRVDSLSIGASIFIRGERASVIIKLDILVKVSFYIPRYILPSKVLSCLLNYY